MEKTTARVRTVDQRLLKRLLIVKRLAAQGLICVFCALAAAVYGHPHDGIELRVNGDMFFLGQDIEIDVLIQRDSPYLRRNSDAPRFLLEGETVFAHLIQSSVVPEYDGLHLRYRYRLLHAGMLRFLPELRWQQQRVVFEPLRITVHQPQLSPHTAFFWRLYSSSGEPLPDNALLEQGRAYMLCLNAVFYSPGYAEQYDRMVQELSAGSYQAVAVEMGSSDGASAVRSDEMTQDTAAAPIQESVRRLSSLHDGPTGLLLPGEIIRIECPASENAALSPLLPADIPGSIMSAVFSSSNDVPFFDSASPINGTAIPSGMLALLSGTAESGAIFAFEEYSLAAFRWIPLQTGMQNLPRAQIFFAAGGSAVSRQGSYLINPLKSVILDSSSTDDATDSLVSAAFSASLQGAYHPHSGMTAQQEIAVVKKIAEYRWREQRSLFPFAARRARKKLEASLGGVPSLPIYPRMLGIAAVGFTLLLAISALWSWLYKKKRLMLLCVMLVLCSSGITVALFSRMQLQGVCIASENAAVVRRIPEETGSIIYRLARGEGVFIIRQTAAWYYVKTTGDISGWVPQRSLLLCGKSM